MEKELKTVIRALVKENSSVESLILLRVAIEKARRDKMTLEAFMNTTETLWMTLDEGEKEARKPQLSLFEGAPR